MKKLIFLLLLTPVLSISIYAQGTLQFNEVKLIGSTTDQVPVGKVWKVVGVAGTKTDYRTTSATFSPPNCLIQINGNNINIESTVSTGGGSGTGYNAYGYFATYSASPTSLPLWLPEGTQLNASTNVTYVSVIEFNVVP